MSQAHASEHPPPKHPEHRERGDARVPLEFPSELPWDEHVAETKRHLKARTLLFLLVEEAFPAMSVGCDQFVYFDEEDPRQCLAPDLFVADDVHVVDFDSWKTWELGMPKLAVEVVSAWDRLKLTWEEKLERYDALGIQELVRFDSRDTRGDQPSITIWDRVAGKLKKRVQSSSEPFECKTLGMYWVVTISEDFGKQLRLSRDRAGKEALTTPSEKAIELAERLEDEREARMVAEHARMLAENARKVAEQKQLDAEKKQLDAENAQAASRAEIERLQEALVKALGTK